MDIATLLRKLEDIAGEHSDRDRFCQQAVEAIHNFNIRYDWVGIYLGADDRLTLPQTYYQGIEPGHKEIPFDEGICGAAATARETIVVDDVNADPRYLACSIHTQSEIVVPILHQGTLYGVLDLDSDTPAAFTPRDQNALEQAAGIIGEYLAKSIPGQKNSSRSAPGDMDE